VGPGADAGRTGQGAVRPCREVGVEGATDRVKRLAPRRFSARLGVACVAVGNRDLVGSTFPFLRSIFSIPIAYCVMLAYLRDSTDGPDYSHTNGAVRGAFSKLL
jgi:hypothetical protein